MVKNKKILPDEGFTSGKVIKRMVKLNRFRSIKTFTTTMKEEGISTTDECFVLVIMNGSTDEGDDWIESEVEEHGGDGFVPATGRIAAVIGGRHFRWGGGDLNVMVKSEEESEMKWRLEFSVICRRVIGESIDTWHSQIKSCK